MSAKPQIVMVLVVIVRMFVLVNVAITVFLVVAVMMILIAIWPKENILFMVKAVENGCGSTHATIKNLIPHI